MNKLNMYFNTESVSEGHPDKIADQISELTLNFFIEKDENAHVACEVYVTGEEIIVGGEFKLKNNGFKWEEELKQKIYEFLIKNFKHYKNTWNALKDKENIKIKIQEQSIEIDNQVSISCKEIGAGDNTVVFGFANNDKKNEYFPKFQVLANEILKTIQNQRKEENILKFAPDGKVRITIKNKTESEKLIQIVLCQQFEKDIENTEISKKIKDEIIIPILKDLEVNTDFDFKLISFVKGGPSVDTGLSGRKLMIDTYGTYSRHGGGSFAGKDVSKTDRTLALFARFIAKHIVALNLTEQIEIQMSSFIGETSNFSINYYVKNEKELSKENKKNIEEILKYFSTWSLSKIIKNLNLKIFNFVEYAKYGYFGKDKKDAPWEKLSFLEELNKKIGKKT